MEESLSGKHGTETVSLLVDFLAVLSSTPVGKKEEVFFLFVFCFFFIYFYFEKKLEF